jgi:hypothetical protein
MLFTWYVHVCMYVRSIAKKSSALKSETNDLHVLKIGKLERLIFMVYSIFFAIDCTCVFNFCPPKTDSDSWNSDNRSSTVLICVKIKWMKSN